MVQTVITKKYPSLEKPSCISKLTNVEMFESECI